MAETRIKLVQPPSGEENPQVFTEQHAKEFVANRDAFWGDVLKGFKIAWKGIKAFKIGEGTQKQEIESVDEEITGLTVEDISNLVRFESDENGTYVVIDTPDILSSDEQQQIADAAASEIRKTPEFNDVLANAPQKRELTDDEIRKEMRARKKQGLGADVIKAVINRVATNDERVNFIVDEAVGDGFFGEILQAEFKGELPEGATPEQEAEFKSTGKITPQSAQPTGTPSTGKRTAPPQARPLTTKEINNVYNQSLGRDATQVEIEVNKDTPGDALRTFLYTSDVAKEQRRDIIIDTYEQEFGRVPTEAEIAHHITNVTSITNLREWASSKSTEEKARIAQQEEGIPEGTPSGAAEDETEFVPVVSGADAGESTPGTTVLDDSAGEPKNLIRFKDRPEIYDISGGVLRHVDANEFENLGNPWNSVDVIDSSGLTVDASIIGTSPFVSIGGKIIEVPDDVLRTDTFDNSQITFPGSIVDENTVIEGVDTESLIKELTDAEKLFEVWRRRPDLQEIFDEEGRAKPGSGWEGLNLEDWAMRFGWLPSEVAKTGIQLEEYTPRQTVRAAFLFLTGKDILKEDIPGSEKWIEAVEKGKILSFEELTGALKTTILQGEQLTEDEIEAFKIAFLVPGEADIPEFLFDRKATEEQIAEEFAPFYDDLIAQFRKAEQTTTGRAQEDFDTATTRLAETEKLSKDDFDFQFEDTLRNAQRAYAVAGQAISGMKDRGIRQLNESRARSFASLERERKIASENAARNQQRTLQDAQTKLQLQETLTEEERSQAEGQEFITRRNQAVSAFDINANKAAEETARQNAAGISANTPFSGFGGPDDKALSVAPPTGETVVQEKEIVPGKSQAEVTEKKIGGRTPAQILALFGMTPTRQAKNVTGAVRLGSGQVFTLGGGGRPIIADESKGLTGEQVLLGEGFRADEVQLVDEDEARSLGIQL